MFVNAVEDYGLEEHERPNWINFVREPMERIVSLYYYQKCHPNGHLIGQAIKESQKDIASNFTGPRRYIKKVEI